MKLFLVASLFCVLLLHVNCQSQLPGQFAGASGAIGVFGAIIDTAARYQKARLIENPSTGKCLQIQNGLIGSGIKVVLHDCNWRGLVTPVSELFYAVDAPNETWLLKGAASYSNMCIYTGNKDKDPLYTTSCKTNDRKQQWDFVKISGDEYLIVQISTGRCLRAWGKNNGVSIRSTSCNSDDGRQRWRICNGSRKCN